MQTISLYHIRLLYNFTLKITALYTEIEQQSKLHKQTYYFNKCKQNPIKEVLKITQVQNLLKITNINHSLNCVFSDFLRCLAVVLLRLMTSNSRPSCCVVVSCWT